MYVVSDVHVMFLTLLYFKEEFTDKTQYTIMFGPDKCGEDSKVFKFPPKSVLIHISSNLQVFLLDVPFSSDTYFLSCKISSF